VVCDFGSGTREQIYDVFQCLSMIEAMPDFYEEWVKIDAKRSEWTEFAKFQDGSMQRNRLRLHQGELQIWV
jgi:hypothetical protein